MLERIREIEPMNSDFVIEMGEQRLMMEDFKSSMRCFEEAAVVNESRLEPLIGMIECRVQMGELEDALSRGRRANRGDLPGASRGPDPDPR